MSWNAIEVPMADRKIIWFQFDLVLDLIQYHHDKVKMYKNAEIIIFAPLTI